jgi:subtilisin family serine protease
MVSIELGEGTDGQDLARHLETLEGEVEYAFVPPVKRYLLPPPATTGPDPLLSRQWGHGAVGINVARSSAGFVEATGVRVAVVDSGIDESHPDLQGGTISSYTNFISTEDKRDIVGHGTHVAGIIAAQINNAVGIAGLCQASIEVIKGLPHPDATYDADEYYRALAYAVDTGAPVLNLSLGGKFDPVERDLIEEALEAEITVVAAMGNDYQAGNPIEYPAAYTGVIAVGACDELDRRATFSCTGDHIALVAPGVRILSTVPTYPSHFTEATLYDSWPGTSMATPFVAAAAALLRAKDPTLTAKAVARRLRATADPVAAANAFPNAEYGAGRLNIAAALV